MGTTSDKLNKLLETKQAIKQAIIDKGVEVSDDTVFADYPSKISAIESGGSGDTTTYEHPDFYELRTNGGTDYYGLFYYYYSTSLDLSSWDTSNVTNMANMFYYCEYLTSLDVSSFNTSKVTDMKYMFYYCSKLTSLDLSNFNTSKVRYMNSMFYFCSNLTSLVLSNFDTSKVTEMNYMFNRCSSLVSLDLSSFDMTNVTKTTSMFGSCSALVDLQAPQNISVAISFSACTALSHDSLMSIINNLATVTSTTKLTLGTTNLEKLSDEEKAIATNKGWTLA